MDTVDKIIPPNLRISPYTLGFLLLTSYSLSKNSVILENQYSFVSYPPIVDNCSQLAKLIKSFRKTMLKLVKSDVDNSLLKKGLLFWFFQKLV